MVHSGDVYHAVACAAQNDSQCSASPCELVHCFLQSCRAPRAARAMRADGEVCQTNFIPLLPLGSLDVIVRYLPNNSESSVILHHSMASRFNKPSSEIELPLMGRAVLLIATTMIPQFSRCEKHLVEIKKY